jgi:adenylate kinase
MMGRVVAVLGISGVGKTTMVSTFTRHHPWAHSVRASALLNEAVEITDTEALRTASASVIHANQDRLTSAFSELRRRHPDRHIIFDGHSLIDNDKGLVIVPPATFVKLAPNLIVFLEEDANTILARRLADVDRVRPRRSAEEIAAHQYAAKEVALEYGATLTIPCLIIRSGDSATFEAALKREFVGQA